MVDSQLIAVIAGYRITHSLSIFYFETESLDQLDTSRL